MTRAIAAESRGDLEEALRFYGDALAAGAGGPDDTGSPDDAGGAEARIALILRMAGLLQQLSRWEDVVRLIEGQPDYAHHRRHFAHPLAVAYSVLAAAALQRGEWQSAKALYGAAHAQDPDNWTLAENVRRIGHNIGQRMTQVVQASADAMANTLREVPEKLLPAAELERRCAETLARLQPLDQADGLVAALSCMSPLSMDGADAVLSEDWTALLPSKIKELRRFRTFHDIVEAARHQHFDIVISTNHFFITKEDYDAIDALRSRSPDTLFVVWLWDNHHLHYTSTALADKCDIVVPAHEITTNFLKVCNPHVLSCVPAATFQWTIEETSAFFLKHHRLERSDSLYGAFFSYPDFERDAFIRRCQDAIPGNALYLRRGSSPVAEDRYRRLTAEDQFLDWMRYKVSLVASIMTDIPIRLFDALLAGQIPLVPTDFEAFDLVVPVALQAELPVFRYNKHSLASVHTAYRRALARFEADGIAGTVRRHTYARDHHMLPHRGREILDRVLHLARCYA